MKLKYAMTGAFVAIGLLLFAASGHSQDQLKLKLGARGTLCLNCHVDFQEKIKSPFVHTPVKTGDCAGCHNPHASSHGKFLAEDPNRVCFLCHKAIVPERALSVHKVVAEGNCVKCHDPHASANRFNLLKAGNDLCFDCHKDKKERAANIKFRHAPAEKGCTNCHNPHGSAKAASLLVSAVPGLCVGCHKTSSPTFSKQHMDYPVAGARCTTCHDPHGSNRGGILYDNVHRPVANKMCNQCHEEPISQTPFATKRPGYQLCAGCHNTLMNNVFGQKKVHWPLMSARGCLSCHNPHASTLDKLLSGPMTAVCGKCHKDTIERQARSQSKHPPIQEGNCTVCHSPHSSNSDFLLLQSSIVELCGSCHDWLKHSSHPIGEKFIDPRNKNLIVQCLSCHRSHGTENKKFIYFPVISEMCVQCHIQYKR